MVDTLRLADGRELTYDIYGDPDGVPVVFTHGFRSSRLIRNPDDALTASLGIRMIAVDQPGVGGSTPQPGRRVIGWGADIEQVADQLGVGDFAVAGHSGGTPHALAIAAHLPERVTRGALAGAIGPLDDDTFASLFVKADMVGLVAMHSDPARLRSVLAADVENARRDIVAFVESVAAGDSPADARSLLADPAQRAMFEASYMGGVTQDEEGRFETFMALWDWGFELGDVRQPFDLFHGDADWAVPVEMSTLMARRLPNGTVHVWPDAGHNSFVDRPLWIEFLTALGMPHPPVV